MPRGTSATQLGSVSFATNASGSSTSRQDYDAWGAVRSGGISATSLNYTGQRLDSTGLLDYHARLYDPTLARFVSADTIVPGAGALAVWPSDATAAPLFAQGPKDTDGTPTAPHNPQDLNRYAYVENNPIRYTDPSGHCIGILAGLDTLACATVIAGGAILVGGALVAITSSPNDGMRWGDYDWTDWSIPWLKSETNDNYVQLTPEKPVGSLTTPNGRFWEKKGVDPHMVKDAVVGGKVSDYDLHLDKNKNVWVKRKGEPDSKAIYVGPLDQVMEDYPIEDN